MCAGKPCVKVMNLPSFFSFACSSTSYLAFHSLYTSSSSTKRWSPLSLEIVQIKALKALSGNLQLSNVLDRSLFRSLSNQNEKEMILKQNLAFLVPKYIETISFAFLFLEQIKRADWSAIVLGSWTSLETQGLLIGTRSSRSGQKRSSRSGQNPFHWLARKIFFWLINEEV